MTAVSVAAEATIIESGSATDTRRRSSSSAARTAQPDWVGRYAAATTLTDAAAIAFAVLAGVVVGDSVTSPDVGTLFAVALGAAWMLVITVIGSRSRRVVGWGSTEYRRIVDGTALVFTGAVLVAYSAPIPEMQVFLLTAIGTGLPLLALGRFAHRKRLYAHRRQGTMTRRALLIGSEESIAQIGADLQRIPEAGIRVVGACVTGTRTGVAPGGIPLFGEAERITAALVAADADTVVLTGTHHLSPNEVRRLSWALEPGRQHLVVAPSLTDVSGPRVHTRPVAGLPLLHIETPRFEGGTLVVKRVFDILVAGTLLVLLSPVLAVLASAVRSSGPGGILFRQQRIGRNGATFDMLKFRSMHADADRMVDQLSTGDRDAGNAVLFKMKDDPRVTSIGRILRRYSLDELPQLVNVLRGDMSLVGPRPPLEREVAAYADHVHRRFLVKPGITGLWQVSGRSDLSWEESVRLDLYYVENWSLMGDIVILWKTARAVFSSDGAY